MTSVGYILWGPASYSNYMDSTTTFSSWYYALDDANDAIAGIFCLPKDGTITKIGFYVVGVVGSSPNYKVGLTTQTNGVPDQAAYGGSSIYDYTPDTSGWKWITLGTSASGSAGDFVCVHIYPGTSAPNSSNCIKISDYAVFFQNMPWYREYSTSWNYGDGPIATALQYDDGTIVGFPVVDTAAELISNATTPDEVGNVFTVPIDMTVKGLKFWSSAFDATGVCEFILYDSDDNILGSASTYGTTVGAGWYMVDLYFDTEVELVADATYRLVMKPSDAETSYLDGWKFNSATDRQTITYPESERWYKTERTDGGTWTDSDDSIMHMGLIVSDIASGTSGSGAGPGATNYYGFIG